MAEHTQDRIELTGLLVGPVGPSRRQLQAAFGEQFSQLHLADDLEQARLLLRQHAVDLLVIDLERFERSFDAYSLRELISHRAGARTLILCPWTCASWLPELMSAGSLDYVITPLAHAQLRDAITSHRGAPPAGPSLQSLIATTARVQLAIDLGDDLAGMAGQACTALAATPGVLHASLFHMRDVGELALVAQHATTRIDLHAILQHTERLLLSPLRHAFPGLLAAASGEITLLDDPAKAGHPEMAQALADAGIGMVVGIPLPPDRAGVRRGALCLMYERARTFSSDEMNAFVQLGQLVSIGVRMADLRRENARLQGRLNHLATTDTLTNVANRRHGEYLIALEARRSGRYRLPMSLLVFDIDGLKAINDQYGHAVGDAAVRAAASAAQGALRESDVLVRAGGGEFQIIAPHTVAADALKVAEKIRATIAASDVPGCDHVTVSVGVGQLQGDESPDTLLVRVATALARAKRAGYDRVELAMG